MVNKASPERMDTNICMGIGLREYIYKYSCSAYDIYKYLIPSMQIFLLTIAYGSQQEWVMKPLSHVMGKMFYFLF